MRAVTFAEYGGPEVLRVEDVEVPQPAPGQVRIAVRAASVNPFDIRVRSGSMRERIPLTLPHVIGHDAAGEVDGLGAGVSGVAIGDHVLGLSVSGAAAEHTVLDDFVRKPSSMSWEEAAGLANIAETSARAFRELGGLSRDQTIVINGAAGGVGSAAVQIAVARGARVIGTGSEGNHDYLRGLGAAPTIYGPGLVARVQAMVDGPVDLAFDTAGRGALPDLITLTGDPRRVVTVADPAAPSLGVKLSHGDEPRAVEGMSEAVELYERAQFVVHIEHTFSFRDAAQAHRRSEAGHVRGKLILVPD